ncbi:MAG TPA: histidine kinase [Micromonosporaceae bacterium]
MRRALLPLSLGLSIAYVLSVQFGAIDLTGTGAPAPVVFVLVVGVWSRLCYRLGLEPRLVVSITGALALNASLLWGDVSPFPVMVTVGFWLVGRIVLGHRTVARRLRARTFELAAEHERYVDEAVRYERARIARDLHDVVAHRISVIVIQATAGQRLPAGAETGDLVAAIEEMTRAADADIAGLIRLLDGDPGIGDGAGWRIDELLASATSAGARLDRRIDGDVRTVPAYAGAIAYRVVQEGLTNALRYAPGAPIEVAVDCADPIRVDVINEPPMRGVPELASLGSGHGLIGLSERVRAAGGTIHSGPTAGGGWRLGVVMPLR